MKVILLKDEKTLGKKNTIVTVSDGYAKNVLIPKKIVEEATADALHRMEGRISKEKLEYQNNLDFAKKTKEQIENIDALGFVMEASEDGKMFGSVTSKDIVEKLGARNIVVDKRGVCLDKPLKTFGKHTVEIKLFGGVKTSLCVEILE